MELEAARCAILPQLIERHLAMTGQAPSRFGRDAVGDPRFIWDMRKGRQISLRTKLRILAYIDGAPLPKYRHWFQWLPEHDEILWTAALGGARHKQIAAQLGRTSQAVTDRLVILKDIHLPWRLHGFRLSYLRTDTASGSTSL